MLYILLGLIAGVATPTQIGVNNRLKKSMGGRSLPPSLLSFLIAAGLTQIALLLSGQGFLYPLGELFHYPLWIWLGGFCGLTILFLKVLSFTRIGSVQSMIYMLLGQLVSGLVIDHLGLLRTARSPLTFSRGAGAALVFLGVILASDFSQKKKKETSASPAENAPAEKAKMPLPVYLFWLLVSVFAGVITSIQIAINATFIGVVEHALKATAIQFHYCVIVLLPAIILYSVIKKKNVFRLESGGPLWMWLGGPFGGFIIFLLTFLGSQIGTGLTTILSTVGTIAGSVLIDHFGFFGIQKKPVTRLKLIGLAVMVGGVVVLRLL